MYLPACKANKLANAIEIHSLDYDPVGPLSLLKIKPNREPLWGCGKVTGQEECQSGRDRGIHGKDR